MKMCPKKLWVELRLFFVRVKMVGKFWNVEISWLLKFFRITFFSKKNDF